jgi:ParB-like chromosome segregation protein Spo0J
MEKKTFDAVAFMRKRREELPRAYAGLSADQIEGKIQQALKDDPLRQRHRRTRPPRPPRRKPAAVLSYSYRLDSVILAKAGIQTPIASATAKNANYAQGRCGAAAGLGVAHR